MNLPKAAQISVFVIAENGVVGDHITRALTNASNVEVVGPFDSALTGMTAYRNHQTDAVILDIGANNDEPLVTMNRLLRIDPHAKIIMASTLSFANVRKSMIGFERGAADFIQTPAIYTRKSDNNAFRTDLLRRVTALAVARRREVLGSALDKSPIKAKATPQKFTLRNASIHRPSVLAIGSSTGGPEALYTVINNLPENFPLPILVTQHMPKLFTAVLANTISKRTGKIAIEATHGMVVEPGKIYIAPGDHHMTVLGTPQRWCVVLDQNPPVNFCRPSVDPMLKSIVNLHKAKTLVVILTGMGADGKIGAELAVNAGGSVIAQDAATSVVWGMPGAVAEAGLCCQVLPLDKIAAAICRIVKV